MIVGKHGSQLPTAARIRSKGGPSVLSAPAKPSLVTNISSALLVYFLITSALISLCATDDLAVLAAFYNSTNGPYWTSSCRWSYPPSCSSYGITCSSSRVTRMSLGHCNITGTLPQEWSSMTELNYVYLHSNQLSGTLPHQWSRMSKMNDMSVSYNQLTGSLPPEWSNMSQLRYLQLYLNQLNGTLPHQWSNLSELSDLDLRSNRLSGTLPHQWSSMTELYDVNIYSNQLTGTLPHQWSSMIWLMHLDLSYNNLFGKLPKQWSSMAYVWRIDLSRNELSGTLPHQWSRMSSLDMINLDYNKLCGTIPAQWQLLRAATSGYVSLQSNYLTLFQGAWYTTSPYTSRISIDALTSIPAVLCDSASQSHSFSRFYTHPVIPSSSPSHAPSRSVSVSSHRNPTSSPSDSALLSYSLSIFRTSSSSPSSNLCSHSRSQSILLSSSRLKTLRPTASGDYASESTSAAVPSGSMSVSTWHTDSAQVSATRTRSSTESPTHSAATHSALSYVTLTKQHTRSNSATSIPSTGTHSTSATPAVMSSSPSMTATSNTTTSTSLSVRCELQRCGVRALTHAINSSFPRTTLLSAALISTPQLRSEPVAYAAVAAQAVALRLGCDGYPLPLHVRNAVLLYNGAVLVIHPAEQSDELLLALTNASFVESDKPAWLPADALPFRTGNAIRIGLTISCDGDVEIVVTVPVLPEALPALVSFANTVSSSAQWVSAAGGAGAAGSVGRVAAAQRLLLCSSAGSSSGGLLGMSVGNSGADEINSARGAVAGNIAVLAAATTVLLSIAVAYGIATGSDARSSLLRVTLPSSLFPVWMATLPSTAAALPLLVVSDICVFLLGVIDVLLPMVALIALPLACSGKEDIAVVERHVAPIPQPVHCGALPSMIKTLFQRSFQRRWRWVSVESGMTVTGTSSTLMRSAWVVLLDYRVSWYPALDAGVLTTTCVLGVVSGMGDARLCRSAGWAMLALCIGHLCACLVTRPMMSLASNVNCVSCLALTCAALLVQCVNLSRGGESLPTSVMTTAVVLQLAVVGLSLVKSLDDARNVFRSVLRLAAEMRRLRAACTASAQDGGCTDEMDAGVCEFKLNEPNYFDDFVCEQHNVVAKATSVTATPFSVIAAPFLQLCEETEGPDAPVDWAPHYLAPRATAGHSRRLMLYEELANLTDSYGISDV